MPKQTTAGLVSRCLPSAHEKLMVAYSILVITIYILLHIHSGILIADADLEHGRDHSFHREKVCTIDIYTFNQPS